MFLKALSIISESTIDKVIKRNNFFFQKSGRIYHDLNSGWAKRKRKKRIRVKYPHKYQQPGHLQIDSITLFLEGIKRYLFSAVDIYSRFAFSFAYKTLNSRNALDYFQKLKRVYPGEIKSIQSDNGLEFLGMFDDYLRKNKIPHFFTYPHCPRVNGLVERYQRSLQEEFVNQHLDILATDLSLFNQRLMIYLIWYNTKRVHQSLGLQTPIDYLIIKGYLSQMYVTYTGNLQT